MEVSLINFRYLLRRQEKWSGHRFLQEKCLRSICEIRYIVIFLHPFKTNLFGVVYICVCCSFIAATVMYQSYDMAFFIWALWAFTWSSGQRKNFWHRWSRYIKFTGFHITTVQKSYLCSFIVLQVCGLVPT